MLGLAEAVSVSGAGVGSEVICDPIVHFGAMATVYFNAVPRFADIEPATYNKDPASLEANITERTKAVIVTHLHDPQLPDERPDCRGRPRPARQGGRHHRLLRQDPRHPERGDQGLLLAPARTVPKEAVVGSYWFACTWEGDREGLDYNRFKKLAAEKGIGLRFGFNEVAPYEYDFFRQGTAYGQPDCPIRCPINAAKSDYRYRRGSAPRSRTSCRGS
jgi:hypothetical protein